MNIFRHLLIIASIAFFCDCTSELYLEDGRIITTNCFNASFETMADTKASFDSNWLYTWDDNDCIGVYSDLQKEPIPYFRSPDGMFYGEEISGTVFYAYYPYESITVDAEDPFLLHNDYRPGCLLGEKSKAPIVAVSSNNQLHFKQTMGALHFTLKSSTDIRSVMLADRTGSSCIGGEGFVDLRSDVPLLSMQQGYSPYLVWSIEADGSECGAEGERVMDLFFFLPEMTLPKGLYLSIMTEKPETVEKTTWNRVDIHRAEILSYPAIDVDELFNEKQVERDNERDALIAFYNAMGGENWFNNTNWCSDKPLNEWYGVTMYAQYSGGQVVGGLNLDNNNLVGQLTTELLAPFKYLERLSINNNYIQSIQLDGILSLYHLSAQNVPAQTAAINNCHFLEELLVGYELRELNLANNRNFRELHLVDCGKLKSLNVREMPSLTSLFMDRSDGLASLDLTTCTEMRFLNCANVSNIDVTNCRKLEQLIINSQNLTDIDLSNNNELEVLWLLNTPLEHLELGLRPKLHSLEVTYPLFSELDISGCINLEQLLVLYAPIENLDISNNRKLEKIVLDCSSISAIDLSGCTDLIEFSALNANIARIDVSNCPKLKAFQPYGNPIGELDISNNLELESLWCYNCGLSKIDISANTELKTLQCGKNDIKEIDLSYHPNLETVLCADCDLKTLDISTNYKLSQLVCTGNPQLDTVYIYPGQPVEIDKDARTVLSDKGSDPAIFYKSTDYSKDGIVKQIHTASKGNGIDVIILGDGFTDRLIDDGAFDRVAEQTRDALFTHEPYKSFSNLFNVYAVTAVSRNEEYESGCSTAFSVRFAGGSTMIGNHSKAFEYAALAVPEGKLNNSIVIVVANAPVYAGTCYMYEDGQAIAYVPLCTTPDEFVYVLSHEAGGHAFAKLGDEYPSEWGFSIDECYLSVYNQGVSFGWFSNVDINNTEETVKWARFLSDERYVNERLGIYEGAFTFNYGIYRPSWDSIMRYGNGGFNAPSREAIYKRMLEIAYGDTWSYDYESFVEYDKINIPKSTKARLSNSPYVNRKKLLPPPVIICNDTNTIY